MKILNDIFNFYRYYKTKKLFNRVFFFENRFIEKHLSPYLFKNKHFTKTLIVTLYQIDDINLKNFKIIKFNYLFLLEIFFRLVEQKYIYSSTPDLGFSSFQKSIKNNVKYIYIQHSPTSLTMIYNECAFIQFNTILTVNRFQKNEISEINSLFNVNIKSWKSKYLFLQPLIKKEIEESKIKKVLLAPTWATDFYKNNYHIKIRDALKHLNYEIVLRPHYMSFKKNDINIDEIKNEFILDQGDVNFNDYDILITDWSGIFLEFSNLKKTRCILINSSKKIRNKNYLKYKNIPLEIHARDILGVQIDPENIQSIDRVISEIILNKHEYRFKIDKFFNENYF